MHSVDMGNLVVDLKDLEDLVVWWTCHAIVRTIELNLPLDLAEANFDTGEFFCINGIEADRKKIPEPTFFKMDRK